VLPYVTDEQLRSELAAIVHAGWSLPQRHQLAGRVRHLLLLADPGEALSYAQAAQRVLHMLDVALQLGADEESPVVSEGDALGLRILFGVHPEYRTEASPIKRRSEAAEYLVPGWGRKPARDRAGTFLKRHQVRSMQLAVECLRARYGQEPRQTHRETDLLEQHRWYLVGGNRQVVRMRCQELVRVRIDDLDEYVFHEYEDLESAVADHDFRVLQHPKGPLSVLRSITPQPFRPPRREIVLKLPRRYAAGDVLGVAWEEAYRHGPDAPRWRQYYVSATAPNDNFELRLTVTFAHDAELPTRVWWYSAFPGVDESTLAIDPDRLLEMDSERSVSYSWRHTDRWINYGLQWQWQADQGVSD
jgi:hypothetical protein